MKKLRYFLKKNFITGLLVVVPVGATIYVLKGLLGWIDRVLGDLPVRLVGIDFPGLGIITLLLLILMVGMLSANYIGTRVLRVWDDLMQRVPLVRGVYSTIKQIMETFSLKQNFRGVAMVEYPRAGCRTVGFVTGEVDGAAIGQPGKHVIVFVPTTPNPTAGFLLMLPEEEVRHLDMTVEEGMKFIISLGLVPMRDPHAKPGVCEGPAETHHG